MRKKARWQVWALELPVFNWLFSYYACAFCGSRKIEVIQPDLYTDIDHASSLRTLLIEVNKDITRYRDYEWKMVVWQAALSWGLFGFGNIIRSSLNDLSTLTDWVTDALIIIGTALLSSNLLFIHGELTTNRIGEDGSNVPLDSTLCQKFCPPIGQHRLSITARVAIRS